MHVVKKTLGSLSDYLKDEKLEKYDRIYYQGHLCVYRNLPKN